MDRAWAVLLIQKMEISKTKDIVVKSTFKTDIINVEVELVMLISNFFITKTAQATKLVHEKDYLKVLYHQHICKTVYLEGALESHSPYWAIVALRAFTFALYLRRSQ